MTMQVGLDISALDPNFKAHAQRGIGRYVRELWKYFSTESLPAELAVGQFDHRAFNQGGWIDRCVDRLPVARNTVRQQLLYPLRLSNSITRQFDVLHFPAHMDAPSWCRKKYVLTVLDLIPLVFQDLYLQGKPSWRFKLARWLEIQAIRNADLILAISENTAKDVERILKIPAERIVITPLGVDRLFFEAGERQLSSQENLQMRSLLGLRPDSPLVLYVGGIDQRKNWIGMFESFRAVVDYSRAQAKPLPQLLMAGNIQNDRQYPKLLALRKKLSLEADVILAGFVSETDLFKLYRMSSVFFFPSLYEGFGLPVLEAMAAGTPVVSSHSSAMPEVIGQAGLLYDPNDPQAGAQAVISILSNANLAQELVEKGRKQASLFSWSKTGALTYQAYQKVLAVGTARTDYFEARVGNHSRS